ncbi:helix-turn-helix transcriptional regulator [Mycobacterium yunnanensis]|uniref:Helix-turn-helix transcriptional regulator n=1 Tax=Mycobacterium yunnanensis TaxID=368477 RepID=A0A9X3BT04_9MYCO|nr:helix-turn-helix transcriptional regulator [Mycobacterium yunnanensis]MCV7421144.1 helix-turn-helix transcriptional regulator [Mycobacterium yunnanensis]
MGTSVTLQDYSRLVSAIHDAAVTPDHWNDAMTAACASMGGISAALVIAENGTRAPKSANLAPDAHRTYLEYYCEFDYVLDAVEHGPVGMTHSGDALIALNPQSEFNNDWMRPHHMDDGLFVRLTDGAHPTCFLVASPKQDDPFATPERVELVNALIPHLQQALRTQDHLSGLTFGARDVAEAVDNMRHGIFVVGPACAVTYANRVAEDMVAVGDGLVVRWGRIGLGVPSADARLQRSVADALGDNDSGARHGNSLLCPRTADVRPYVVHVVPFTSLPPDRREPRVLVIVVDPERQAQPDLDLLIRLFGLTRAEAEVAMRVLRGDGLRPISDELTLSLATVKTHLQRIFAKTSTHRQAELVRLLLTVTP